ncbi:MAG: hypothetical protein PHU04_02125 [Candidatus Peribacteraceae bacterium]|nr:hypothetical protein [Candidatus Peribacteraceae bacterium]
MRLLLLRIAPLRLLRIFLRRFLPWYFMAQPVRILRAYVAYAAAFSEIFSIFFLLKTLVSPWKSIAETYPKNMLLLGRVMQVFTLNCTARAVGAVVRTGTIFLGILVQIVLVACFAAAFLFWITFPILAVLGCQLVYNSIVS